MNTLLTIQPYKIPGTGVWAFDDETAGLHREPFVGDINSMIDAMVIDDHVRNPEAGFQATFSAVPFPGWTMRLIHLPDGGGCGADYYCPTYDMTGWLCPVLFKYFPAAPAVIYARGDSLGREPGMCRRLWRWL